MQIQSGVSIARQAAEGLRRMGDASHHASREVGDAYLGSIAASGSDPERSVARVMREATAQRQPKDASAVAAQRVALQALAAGVGGAVGPALTHVGLAMLDAVTRPADACTMAEVILAALDGGGARSGNQILAETVKIAGTNCLDRNAAVEVFRDGLRALEADPPERMEAALARFGLAARSHACGADARAVGQIVFQQLDKHSTDAAVRSAAHRAFEDSIPDSADLWGAGGSAQRIDAMQYAQFEAILAEAARLDETAARERMDELQRMAGGERRPVDAGRVEIKDGSVVIGGVRVDKKA